MSEHTQDKTDTDIIIDILKDELEGIASYTEMVAVVTCPVLKETLIKILVDEKQHAKVMVKLLEGKI